MNRLVILGLVSALTCFGCGDDDGPEDGGTDSGGLDAGGTDTGTGEDAGPGDDGGPDQDAGPGDDTGPGDDAGTDDAGPESDAGPMRDTGPMRDGGGMVGVMCGDMRCGADEKCCITGIGSAGMCIDRTMDCSGVELGCDGPEDCEAGQVCCGRRSGGGGGATCTDSCAGGPGGGGLELCHDADDCSESGVMCCPAGDFIPADGFCSELCIGI